LEYVEFSLAGRPLRIETAKIARQASGASTIRYADTVVFAAAVYGEPLPEASFLPLTVDYREKMYAAGKYPGGFFKREGRPTTQEVLTMRMVDRPIRPLFPKGYTNQTSITTMVLSYDQENNPDVLAVNAASCALFLAGLPFDGPIGCVRIGRIGNDFVVNPTRSQMERSSLSLVVCGTDEKIVMIEGDANEVSPDVLVSAIRFAREPIRRIIDAQRDLAKKVGVEKVDYTTTTYDKDIYAELRTEYYDIVKEKHFTSGKFKRRDALNQLFEKIVEERGLEEEEEIVAYKKAFSELEKRVLRDAVLNEGRRADGRTVDELRPISAEVGLLPRTHGSALFTKGETQAMVTVTLGSVTDAQLIDGLPPEYTKKFMLHYNFPGFSVGEVWIPTGPKRREIGHGALAERALELLVPQSEDFPYTIRVVSDILESDGSTSMATVCGGTLSMMDAGVPLRRPVAGVSIGLVSEEDRWVLLSDICGIEDFCGDMDFKVASTDKGITAVQLDIKLHGISEEIIEAALNRALQNNEEILQKMLSSSGLSRPRESVSIYAPKIAQLCVDPEKIGLIIGSQGRTIRKIQSETGATVEIEEDGTVTISGQTEEAIERAKDAITALTSDVEAGKIYTGKVHPSVRSYGRTHPGQGWDVPHLRIERRLCSERLRLPQSRRYNQGQGDRLRRYGETEVEQKARPQGDGRRRRVAGEDSSSGGGTPQGTSFIEAAESSETAEKELQRKV